MSKVTHIPPLVIFGLGAGDAEYLRQWGLEGYLPTIASIKQQGCCRSIYPEQWLSGCSKCH